MVSVEDIRLETGRDSAALQRQSRLHSIRCFRHCRNFVFYFELPDLCPVCNGDLLTTEVKVPPFVLKSPINTAVLGEPSVLIKPARGKSLLNDYHSGDNLHCGILDETGQQPALYYSVWNGITHFITHFICWLIAQVPFMILMRMACTLQVFG